MIRLINPLNRWSRILAKSFERPNERSPVARHQQRFFGHFSNRLNRPAPVGTLRGVMTPPESFADSVARRCRRLGADHDAGIAGLIQSTAPRLVRLAVSITRHQHDAEDAVQTVFVRVATRPDALLQSDHPWAYLLAAVRHESFAVVRRSRRLTFFRTLADLTTWLPVDRVDEQETVEQVWRAIRRLPADQAEVVVLKLWEDLTFPQIAEVVGVPVDTASSRYRYALAKLRRSLGDLCPSPKGQPHPAGADR